MNRKIRQAASAAKDDMSWPYRVLRFAGVGAASSLVYVLLVGFYVELVGLSSNLAAVVSYLTALPINYLAHHRFTFRSRGTVTRALPRFVILHLCNMAISLGGMAAAVDLFGLSYWVGAFAAVVLVPLSTFLVMDFWVFLDRKRG